MNPYQFISTQCEYIEEKSAVTRRSRCFVAGFSTYKKRDGSPFTQDEQALISRDCRGQVSAWSFSEDLTEAKVQYECDSGD